jgi:hypothetical protein
MPLPREQSLLSASPRPVSPPPSAAAEDRRRSASNTRSRTAARSPDPA